MLTPRFSLGADPAGPPVRLDRPEQRTHDYVRHGTITLFAAVEVATERIID
jgi:hypothetical protein